MRISDWSSDVCSSDLVLHGYRGKGFKYPAVDMQPFPWRQKAGRGLFHAKHPSCYGGRRDRRGLPIPAWPADDRSEEHTSELQSLMRNSYAVFCLKKKKNTIKTRIQS